MLISVCTLYRRFRVLRSRTVLVPSFTIVRPSAFGHGRPRLCFRFSVACVLRLTVSVAGVVERVLSHRDVCIRWDSTPPTAAAPTFLHWLPSQNALHIYCHGRCHLTSCTCFCRWFIFARNYYLLLVCLYFAYWFVGMYWGVCSLMLCRMCKWCVWDLYGWLTLAWNKYGCMFTYKYNIVLSVLAARKIDAS